MGNITIHYFLNWVIIYVDKICNPITVVYDAGFNITWKETQVGVTVEAPCRGPKLNGKSY